MQEAAWIEQVEQVFEVALVQTYQRDGLIDLYSVLRWGWQHLVKPDEQLSYLCKFASVYQRISAVSLQCQQGENLAQDELAVIRRIESQFAQLERQVKLL